MTRIDQAGPRARTLAYERLRACCTANFGNFRAVEMQLAKAQLAAKGD
jgi:hypothetical protein